VKPFYFKIPSAHVVEVVHAENLKEAKQKAFTEWSSLWSQIEWLTPDTVKKVRLPNV
jgi:hypothetical protein